MFKRKTIGQHTEEDTKYFISNSWFYLPYFEINENDFSETTKKSVNEIKEMYNTLHSNYKPVKIFKPDFWTNGPELKAYLLN